ncbi:MAG: hypothetical protein ACPG06_04630, partial [Alphaproteobacteria bacterium]
MQLYDSIARQSLAFVTALGLAVQPALAGDILIVNGIEEVGHGGVTQQITDNLTGHHEAVGNTVFVENAIPDDLSGFDQVWDLRVGNHSAHNLSEAQQQQYLAFLQSGGGMFVMGENSGFTARNNTVLALIALAGGGSIALNGEQTFDLQRVHDRFNQPNAITDQDFFYGAA